MKQRNPSNWTTKVRDQLQQDDRLLKSLVKPDVSNCWKQISLKLKKSAQSCRERHMYLHNENIRTCLWSQEEEDILFAQVLIFGNKWTQIQSFFDGRSDQAIKNQFYNILKKTLRKLMKVCGNKQCTQATRKLNLKFLVHLYHNDEKDPEIDEQLQMEFKNLIQTYRNTTPLELNQLQAQTVKSIRQLIDKVVKFADRTRVQKFKLFRQQNKPIRTNKPQIPFRESPEYQNLLQLRYSKMNQHILQRLKYKQPIFCIETQVDQPYDTFYDFQSF